MKATNVSGLDYDHDDAPTAKTCQECHGEGSMVVENGTRYTVKQCRWCKGTGRIPVSGTMPAVRNIR